MICLIFENRIYLEYLAELQQKEENAFEQDLKFNSSSVALSKNDGKAQQMETISIMTDNNSFFDDMKS
jgi:hypothetical protein